MSDLPTSPDLQAEADRVFADVQRAVLVEDAKQVVAKALQAAKDEATEAAATKAEKWADDLTIFKNVDAGLVMRTLAATIRDQA